MEIKTIIRDGPSRIKVIRISAGALVSLLTNGVVTEILEGIPVGAKAIGCRVSQDRPDEIILAVEHESFDLVPENEAAPFLTPFGHTFIGKELEVMRKFLKTLALSKGIDRTKPK